MRQPRVVRLLTFTSLYPNALQPAHGLFVERRLAKVVEKGATAAIVVAPVPFWWQRRGRGLPRVEQRLGLTVHHPRFFTIPGLGRFLAPFTMFLSSIALVRSLNRANQFDVIDAHYLYPDGVAAALLSRALNVPLIVTARGTDVNVLPNYRFSRLLILWATRIACHVVTVSEALRRRLIELGVDSHKVTTLRNGVDTEVFRPRDRELCRTRVQVCGSLVLLSVGNLVEAKGHDVAMGALRYLPGAHLVIVGNGRDREALRAKAAELGVSDRVRFTGVQDQDQLIDYYNAADVLVLASRREGMPNVVLEALSCGLPVVATRCGGIPEVLVRAEQGRLVSTRNPEDFAKAILAVMANGTARGAVREASLDLDWDTIAERQSQMYVRHGLGI